MDDLKGLVERQVAGSKDQVYTVKVVGQRASCTCLGYEHRLFCKHITALRDELGITGPLVTGGLK